MPSLRRNGWHKFIFRSSACFVCFVLDSLALYPKDLFESIVGRSLLETSAAGVDLKPSCKSGSGRTSGDEENMFKQYIKQMQVFDSYMKYIEALLWYIEILIDFVI